MATEPGAARPQARRGAVGRRPGRLAHRAVPARRSPSGTTGSATPPARSGWPTPAAPRTGCPATACATWRRACPGSVDLFGHSDPPLVRGPSRVGQLRHRPRRLHARRPGGLRPQAQRGQRRAEPRRQRRQPVVEPRHRGAASDADSPAVDIVPPAPPLDPQPVRHPRARRGHADDHGGRRDGPHPAGQQQRLLPGQRDLLGALGPDAVAHGPARDRPLAAAAAPRAPRAAHRAVLLGPPVRAGPAARTSPGSTRSGVAVRPRPLARPVDPHAADGAHRAAARAGHACCWSSTARSTRCT